MNDVKDLFSRVLDADAPRPMASRDEMMARAHRAAARRRTRRAATACAAAAIVVGAAVGVPSWVGRDSDDGLTTGTEPAVTAGPSRPAPASRLTPERHAGSMLTTLLKHVPGQFTTPATPTFKDAGGLEHQVQGTHVEPPAKEMSASTDVYRGTKAGSLAVAVTVGQGAAPVGDLCVTGTISHQGIDSGCKVVTATDGQPIRFSWRYVSAGRIEYAARFHPGGYVMVLQTTSGTRPVSTPLGRIMTERALADAAADPAFWPTNLVPFPSGP
jgi:hypothetical protein